MEKQSLEDIFGTEKTSKPTLSDIFAPVTKTKISGKEDVLGDIRGIGTDIADNSFKRDAKIQEIRSAMNNGEQGDLRSILQTSGQLAGAGADAIGAVAKGAFNALIPQTTEERITSGITSAVEKTKLPKLMQKYEALKQTNPVLARDIDAALGIASLGAEFVGLDVAKRGVMVAKEGAETAIDISKQAIKEGAEVISDTTAKAVAKRTDAIKGSTQKLVDNIRGTANKDMKVTLDPETVIKKAETDPTFAGLVKEAQKQGIPDADINFLSSVSKVDKPVMKQMFDLAVKAQSNPRQIKRAADVLGDNIVSQVKQVQGLNSAAGKAVDEAAKALKGLAVDATALKDNVLSTLDDIGITIKDGAKLDFSQSVFKNTPKLQKELQRVFSSIPDGSDAYQLHIFKKSIDELVNYGTTGEGLTGQISRILKSFRSSADDVLDSNFDAYNQANTAYKQTKEFLEDATAVAGKKVDLATKEGAQAFGQAMRSAFSNNKSRGTALTFIENIQKIGKELGLKGADQNILDQAIFVTILEETFGSAAATGLAGEVAKGIKKGVEFAGNPIKGGINAAAELIEKSRGITPEAKKKLLQNFLDTKNITPSVSIPKTIPPKKSFSNPSVGKTDLTSSISKAKASGQSFDEWVKGQGETVYRGGKDISPKQIKEAGISVSKGKNVAEDFAKQKGGKVEDIVIAKNAKVIDYADVPNVKYKELNDYSPILDKGDKQIWIDLEIEYQKAVNWAKENGYDAVKLPLEGETRIVNPNIIKTRSQLKAEWDKVKLKKK